MHLIDLFITFKFFIYLFTVLHFSYFYGEFSIFHFLNCSFHFPYLLAKTAYHLENWQKLIGWKQFCRNFLKNLFPFFCQVTFLPHVTHAGNVKTSQQKRVILLNTEVKYQCREWDHQATEKGSLTQHQQEINERRYKYELLN